MFQGFPQGASQIAQGATLYIFNRKEFSTALATVTSVSQPHVSKAAQTNPALGMQGFVVDLSLNIGGDTTSIEFPVNSTAANYPEKGWLVSTDQEAVTREIQAVVNNSKQVLAQTPYHEMIVKKGPALIMQINPAKQMEAQQAERIARLENAIADMSGKFDQMVGMFSAAVQGQQKPKEE